MKKIFKLTHEKIKPARLADAVKAEVKNTSKESVNTRYLKTLISGISLVNLVMMLNQVKSFTWQK